MMQLESTIENYKRDNKILKEELFKYRASEENLGCSLEVLDKAFKNGIYNGVPEHIRAVGLDYINDFYRNSFYALTCFNNKGKQTGCYPTREYKKTWWLKPDKTE